MATVIHDNWRNAQMGKPGGTTTTVDFDADDVRCSLLDQTDSGAITAATSNYGEVDGATVVAAGAAIAAKTVGVVAAGVFDSTVAYTFPNVSGDTADYLTLYKYHATPANAPLIVTWDSATTGLPVIPNGGDITVEWNALGIVKI